MNPITIVSGQNALRAYEDKGVAYGASPINEYVLIDSGQILSGETKIIDFSLLTYDIALKSLWILSLVDNPDIEIDIITPSMALNEKLYRLTNFQNFPFLVLDNRYRLRIKSMSTIQNVLIYAHRVHKIN